MRPIFRKTITTIPLLVFCMVSFAQKKLYPFKLNGTINIDSGEAILMPVNDSTYYPNSLKDYQSNIIDGKFCIKGSIAYPYGFLLFVKEEAKLIYISGMFIVDTGFQNITCNIHALRETPHIINKSMNELTNNFNLKKGVILSTYARAHPNSFVSLWELTHRLLWGYNTTIDSGYDYLSPQIKSTYAGIILGRTLASSRIVGYGKIFPKLNLLNIKKQAVTVPQLKLTTKYTLVDFWFSHCPPCISQFNDLKHLYKAYQSKGFDIVGISTDRKKDTGNWKRIIAQYHLPWPQYLDLDAKNAYRFSIVLYPTNFLLNDKGKIIAKNIEPAQLEHFLKLNLN